MGKKMKYLSFCTHPNLLNITFFIYVFSFVFDNFVFLWLNKINKLGNKTNNQYYAKI